MSSLSPWVNEHKGLVIMVSSAYKMNFRLALISGTSFLYIMNSRGPNLEPWGTHVLFLRLRTQCHHIQYIGSVALDNSWTNPEACLWCHGIWVLLQEYPDLRYQRLLTNLKRPRMELSFGLFRGGFHQRVPRQPSLLSDVYEIRTGCQIINRERKDDRKADHKQHFQIFSKSMTTTKLGGNYQIVSHRLYIWWINVHNNLSLRFVYIDLDICCIFSGYIS